MAAKYRLNFQSSVNNIPQRGLKNEKIKIKHVNLVSDVHYNNNHHYFQTILHFSHFA